jgi:hypothetical protein
MRGLTVHLPESGQGTATLFVRHSRSLTDAENEVLLSEDELLELET